MRIYSKAAAVRYEPSGVRVNTEHPGYMPPMLNPTRDIDVGVREIRSHVCIGLPQPVRLTTFRDIGRRPTNG